MRTETQEWFKDEGDSGSRTLAWDILSSTSDNMSLSVLKWELRLITQMDVV